MNLFEQKKNASKFVGEGKGYIHAESVSGKTQLILSGDMVAIIHGMVAISNRASEITGMSFKQVLEAVDDMHKYGYQAFCHSDRQLKTVDNGFEDLDNAIESARLQADQKNVALTQENSRLRQENEILEHSIGLIKSAYESRLSALQGQVKKLSKEVNKLEHEKMEIQRLVNG